MKAKKASITVSFSWIFMIIIGTFFLILAYNVIGKYQSNEVAKYDIELRQALREILNNVGRTEGIEKNSLRPLGDIFKNKKVELVCEDNIPLISLNDKLDGDNQFLQNYPAFMTTINEGSVSFSYIAVENFRLPFKTTNLLAIASKKNLIVLDTQSPINQKLNEKFTKGAYKELNHWSQDFSTLNLAEIQDNIKNSNLDSIVFVSDKSHPLQVDISQIKQLTYYIEIDDNNGYGTITYHDQKGNTYPFNYIDFDGSESLITMATFSKPDTFQCSYNLIIKNTIQTYNFYIEKTNELISQSKNRQLCSGDLVNYESDNSTVNGAQQTLLYNDMKSTIQTTLNTIKTQKFNNGENLYKLIKQIDDKSKELESYNCVYVY